MAENTDLDLSEIIPEEEPQPPGTEPAKEKLDIARELFEWAEPLVGAVVGIVLFFAFIGSVFTVQMTSMDTTLKAGQMLLISDLFYTPQRGDIIMFTKAGYRHSSGQDGPLVKRLIGLAGDEIKFEAGENGRYGTLYIRYSGEDEFTEQTEQYIKDTDWFWKGDMPTHFIVPEGCVFAMGDNRNNSQDSRDSAIGFVDERFILGRVLLRLTPLNKFGPVPK